MNDVGDDAEYGGLAQLYAAMDSAVIASVGEVSDMIGAIVDELVGESEYVVAGESAYVAIGETEKAVVGEPVYVEPLFVQPLERHLEW